jgi:hypothetical protein
MVHTINRIIIFKFPLDILPWRPKVCDDVGVFDPQPTWIMYVRRSLVARTYMAYMFLTIARQTPSRPNRPNRGAAPTRH